MAQELPADLKERIEITKNQAFLGVYERFSQISGTQLQKLGTNISEQLYLSTL